MKKQRGLRGGGEGREIESDSKKEVGREEIKREKNLKKKRQRERESERERERCK